MPSLLLRTMRQPGRLSPSQIWFESTRDIAAGEELFANYGQGYWDAMVAMPLHKHAPIGAPLWRLHPKRVMIDYL